MAKKIGKGRIIQVDPTGGKIQSSCLNGSSAEEADYTYPSEEADAGLEVDDLVLFVVKLAPSGDDDGEAENIVQIPSSGGCL